jgi:hypothetical protein
MTIVTVLFATVVTFGVFSYMNWHSQAQHANHAPAALKSLIENSLGKDTTVAASDQIATIIDDFDKLYGDSPCVSPPQFQWETILPAIQDIQHTCDTNFSNSLDAIKSLKTLLAFINLEKTSATSIKTATESTAKSTDYSASAKTWSDLAKDYSLVADTEFQPVADKIKSVATVVATTYTALSSALSNQSKPELDKAVLDLQKAYKTLSTINTISLAERTKLVDSFTDSYRNLQTE